MSIQRKLPGREFVAIVSGGIALSFFSPGALAQAEGESDEEIQEIVVIGSQIKGAKITGALSVSILDAGDIETIGVESGDELLEYMAEQGSNFFSEAENISGGVNSARGDIGAYNLRNLGTGNTLVLLNGRRLVNAASYQTEEVGGSFVPVNSANSQTLPVRGLERVEVLRDGASAIYGADAVAGVVNYVLKKDFEGFALDTRYSSYDHMPRNDETVSFEFGKNLNGGRTNLSVFGEYYHRDRVNSRDETRWYEDDFRDRVPAGSPWEDDSRFNNTSANSEYGQYDVISSVSSLGLTGAIWDSAGEFETYPAGDARCQWDLGYGTCGAVDGQGTYRYHNNENRDIYSALTRINVYAFLNHEFDNGVESFTEWSMYQADTNTLRHASTTLSAVAKYRVGAQNYYNPFGPCGSPNRLPDSVIGTNVPCTGLQLEIDNYRWTHVPRVVDNDGEVYRALQGFRGSVGDWDWETAVTWSKALRDDVTHNRISNTLLQNALNDPTPAAFNPFSGMQNSNIEQMLIDVYRHNETTLKMVDLKVSKNDLFELPAGPVGMLVGAEYRKEAFVDDRDPRLDGTINYVDNSGNTFPYISDVLNSSPSSDSSGDRGVTSFFTELQIPVVSRLNVQLAARYEDFSDVGSTTVGKIAAGWQVIDQVKLRASWSEAFRVPNLITVNEGDVARSNTNDDFLCFYADPNEVELDCRYGMQRLAGGSDLLVPEESTNTSYGIVVTPIENLTFTLDFWEIDKTNTIGLFGEENHTVLDLVYRLQAGIANCSTVQGDPAVIRDDPSTLNPTQAQVYLDAGLCPAGQVQQIDDAYANLNERIVKGYDFGFYYNFDTSIGDFDIQFNAAFLDTYEQVPGPNATVLLDAQDSGLIPGNIPVEGFADLVRQDGNPDEKMTLRTSWRRGDWGAALSGVRIGDFIQTSLALPDGTPYVIPSMTTFNASFDYRFNWGNDSDGRARLGIVNFTDERAPLADRSFGYYADVHRDLGISYYVDLRLNF